MVEVARRHRARGAADGERSTVDEGPVPTSEEPEANVALVMLQASRARDEPANAVLPPGAKHLVLWIEVGRSRFRTFRLDLTTSDNRRIATVDGVERGSYGALAVNLPADKVESGHLRITLSGQDPPPAALVGEYQLNVHKR